MTLITPELSKEVGWTPPGRPLEYPTIQEVEKASAYWLLKWYRFLHGPRNREEQKVMNLIVYKVNKGHGH